LRDWVGTVDLDLIVVNAFSVVKTVALVAHTDELFDRERHEMWTRQLASLPRTLKNIYCASCQQSHCGQGNERLNHHE
jgi:hypothetical protein